MLERRTPFDGPGTEQGTAASAIERADLRFTPVRARGLLLLQSGSDSALQDAVSRVLKITLPAPQRAVVLGEHALLWLTPAEWLLELPTDEVETTEAALTDRFGSSLAVVTDCSDAFASLEVGGTGAPEALMTGCSIDLRPQSFPAGRVVHTALADLPVILWNPGEPDRFRCLIDQSFTEHLLSWLQGIMPP